jgi:glyoxylase-like metal-dependent hydrolase (beta-lactamase superfamily II)
MFKLSFFTGGIAQTNGWVIETSDGVLAVDAPEGFADWLAKRSIKLAALYLTHQHFDHVMDAAQIKRDHGCPVLAFADYSKKLTLEALFGAVTGTGLSVEPYQVDTTLEGQDTIRLVGTDWQLLHVPGHSPDSLCLYSADQALLFGGDVLFADSVGRTDFPGGSGELLLAGIARKLFPLPDQVRVFPGHGPETTIGIEKEENPYLQGLG